MFLKELTKNRFITIIYFEYGSQQVCKGRVYKLNLYHQTIYVINEQQDAISIRLASIKEIH
ncbi:YolD-like family protein [Salipaludibacillus sp. CF4.18]|uniref:YolD-like family protein n=1 Tax=Salipaludibacillus sp. CF4.18 TaxID=3373081 RepID=UPI003EE4D47F